jgi:hypothetical protein
MSSATSSDKSALAGRPARPELMISGVSRPASAIHRTALFYSTSLCCGAQRAHLHTLFSALSRVRSKRRAGSGSRSPRGSETAAIPSIHTIPHDTTPQQPQKRQHDTRSAHSFFPQHEIIIVRQAAAGSGLRRWPIGQRALAPNLRRGGFRQWAGFTMSHPPGPLPPSAKGGLTSTCFNSLACRLISPFGKRGRRPLGITVSRCTLHLGRFGSRLAWGTTPPSFFEGFSPPFLLFKFLFFCRAALHCISTMSCLPGRPAAKARAFIFSLPPRSFFTQALWAVFWPGFLFSFTWPLIIQRRRLRRRMDLQKTGDGEEDIYTGLAPHIRGCHHGREGCFQGTGTRMIIDGSTIPLFLL